MSRADLGARLVATVTGLGALTAGCGAGAPKEARAPASAEAADRRESSPQAAYGQPGQQSQPGGAGQSPAATAAPPPPSPATQPASPEAPPEAKAGGPSAEMQRFAAYEQKLDVASGNRDESCKALASMDRSCGVLCSLEGGRRCEDARDRVRSARKRVRTTFGACPDGTQTDPNAPVPSR